MDATVLSVDGVGAYDHVSRQAMLAALRDVPGACRLLPYVRMWYGSPSTYVWLDSVGQPHRALQAEGGEQGDPLMPALFALAMHQALVALQPELRPEERSLAFLDDLYLTAQPDRIQPLFQAASWCLYERARISLNHAKTRVWNAAAVEPPGLADISAADVWRGNAQLPEAEQGITVLGAPLGGNAFVRAQLDAVRNKQLRLLQVPTLPDLQVAWLLLLYCASPRSNYALRIIPPELTDLFAIEHDAAVQRCFSAMLFGEDGGALPDTASRQSQLAVRHGGLGLRSARLHAPAAFWASWADSLSAIQRRDPDLAQHIVRQLEPDVPCCRVLDTLKATVTLLARQGLEAPQWHQLLGDDAPQPHDVEDDAPGIGRGVAESSVGSS